jgi:hypothetical protein
MSESVPQTLTLTSIFTAEDVVILQRDRLMAAARRYFPRIQLSAAYLQRKLLAAEADASRRLRVFFKPRMCLPVFASQEEIAGYAALTPPVPVYLEPGYDYSPDIYSGPRWGLLEVRQRPIVSIESITFTYPSPSDTLYTFPNDWIRPDNKYGVINLVPTQTAVQGISLNAYILSAFSGGLTVPLTLQVRYMAGLQNVQDDYPDLVDLIFKMASLSILEEQYIPQSGSVSADGLSQSVSLDMDKYSEMIETRIERLRQSINGVRMIAT